RSGDSGGGTWLHYRRMLGLLGIGLIHAYLFWYGDILVCYALAGMVFYWARLLPTRGLLVLGIVSLAMPSLLFVFVGLSMPYWPAEAVEENRKEWSPSQQQLQAEIDDYRGSYVDQISRRAPLVLVIHGFMLPFFMIWRVGGLMCLGMVMMRCGVFDGRLQHTVLRRIARGTLIPGLLMAAIASAIAYKTQWKMEHVMFLGNNWNYWGSVLVAVGYVCIWVLYLTPRLDQPNAAQGLTAAQEPQTDSQPATSPVGGWAITWLAPVGRMAFTNYLSQTLICVILFYGIGFGLYGQINRAIACVVMLVIWVVQILWSRWWLSRFRYGPAEWAWRCISYGKSLPLRKLADSVAE
ncbi:MAG: DUF418 domain-containing protein, partial [Planctomycetota bacterium]